jgi:hypothetical protein
MPISPVNIASAALVTQFALCLTMLIAALILVSNKEVIVTVAALSLITLGSLIFSSDVFAFARVVFGNASIDGFRTSAVLFINFILTILILVRFIYPTGGTTSSPFTPILYTIIPLAIFLREPFWHILSYMLIVLIASFACLSAPPIERASVISSDFPDRYEMRNKRSYIVSATLCLLLTTLIGWITRPR